MKFKNFQVSVFIQVIVSELKKKIHSEKTEKS